MNRNQSILAVFVLILSLVLSGCGTEQPLPLPTRVSIPTAQPPQGEAIPTWSQLPSPTVTVPPTAGPKPTLASTKTPVPSATLVRLVSSTPTLRPTLDPTQAALSATMIKWLDNLKTCTHYTFTTEFDNPFGGGAKLTQIQTIKGKEGNLCLVTYETKGQSLITCRFTPEGLKTMTQDKFYEQARSNNWSFSYNGDNLTDDQKVMQEQCKVTQ